MEFVLKLSTELRLTRPITGSEVVVIVSQLVNKTNARNRYTVYDINAIDPDTPDRILVGQASDYSWHHLLVTDPDSHVDGLLASGMYKSYLSGATAGLVPSE